MIAYLAHVVDHEEAFRDIVSKIIIFTKKDRKRPLLKGSYDCRGAACILLL